MGDDLDNIFSIIVKICVGFMICMLISCGCRYLPAIRSKCPTNNDQRHNENAQSQQDMQDRFEQLRLLMQQPESEIRSREMAVLFNTDTNRRARAGGASEPSSPTTGINLRATSTSRPRSGTSGEQTRTTQF